LAGVRESREGDDASDGACFFHRQHRADLAAERVIAGNYGGMRAQERQMLGESLFENRAVSVVQRANERLAGIKCRSPQGVLGKVKGK
jgi:hypothetical protein